MRASNILFALVLTATGLPSVPALALRPDEVLTNPVLEGRARAIGRELRCLVCQNESIDDSDADLAHDLRMLVRRRLLDGDSDDQVKQYLVARYGTYVLLKPPFNSETVFLWLGPLALLAAAGATAVLFYRRYVASARTPSLSAEEEGRVAALMSDRLPQTGG